MTLTKKCITCEAVHDLSFFNRDRTRPDGRFPRCKDCSRRACRESYKTHADEHREMKRRWKNENRERHREINRAYGAADPARRARNTANYRAAKAQATPPWASIASIKTFYEDCPKGWHVDHIEPLRAKDRSGLNVPWNLQYLPADQSFRKGNRTGDEFARGGYYL